MSYTLDGNNDFFSASFSKERCSYCQTILNQLVGKYFVAWLITCIFFCRGHRHASWPSSNIWDSIFWHRFWKDCCIQAVQTRCSWTTRWLENIKVGNSHLHFWWSNGTPPNPNWEDKMPHSNPGPGNNSSPLQRNDGLCKNTVAKWWNCQHV